ncbi:hypothetical protein [Mycobacterium sp. URHB0021]|jgi:hypothetical protein
MTEGPVFHVEVTAGSLADLKAFTDEIQPDDLGCRPVVRRRGTEFVLDAYLPEAQLDTARGSRAAGGVSLEVVENVTEVGVQRQQEVGEGNRFTARGAVPRGLGRKE